MILGKLYRVMARGIQNPRAEIKRQIWNLRDLLFVHQINDRHWYLWHSYPDYLAHGNAAQFIAKTASQYCQGTGIDIGGGKWPLEGAILVDNNKTMNAYNLSFFADNSLDYIFSSHCLEHLMHWEDALAQWISKLRPGGILFLYLPHESMQMWRPGGPWVRDNHVWSPTIEKLIPVIEKNGLKILNFNPGKDQAWSFHVVAEKPKNG